MWAVGVLVEFDCRGVEQVTRLLDAEVKEKISMVVMCLSWF
jgi:hypothetical protein